MAEIEAGSPTTVRSHRESIQSLERGFSILQHLADPRVSRGITVTELAREVDLHKSTVYRLLDTMRQQGFVSQDADSGRYFLGYSMLNVAAQFLNNSNLRGIASSELRELASASGHSVILAVWDRGEVVYLDKVDMGAWTRTGTNIGMRRAAHHTASGRAMLAYLPEEALRESVAREVSSPASGTAQTDADLQPVLQEIRSRGYAVADRTSWDETRGVAAPVFDYRGRVAAAIGISGTVDELSLERLEELAPTVVRAANNLSTRLGHHV